MKMLKIALAVVTLTVPLASFSMPAQAATAHNSQAGANGPTTNDDAPVHRHMKRMKHKKAM